jgi:hypothetical protein
MSKKSTMSTVNQVSKIFNSKSMTRKIAYTCALPLCAALTVANAYAFEPFQANYSFNIAGMLTGTATRTLTKQDNMWSYNFKASVASLANASEVSHFKVKHLFKH